MHDRVVAAKWSNRAVPTWVSGSPARSGLIQRECACTTPRSGHAFGELSVCDPTRQRAQPKLTMTSPGDRWEQEADRVADQVTRGDATTDTAAAGSAAPPLQRACDECQDELQRQPIDAQQDEDEDTQALQGKRVAGGAREVSPALAAQVAAVRGSGHSLAGGVRSFFEPRLGHDFAAVRVHTDGRASESASSIGARAYTVGRDIVFGAGHYAPDTASGRWLLAHELTHVVQQGSSPRLMRQPEPTTAERDDEGEQEGQEAGGVLTERPVDVDQVGGVQVARDLAIPPTKPNAPEPTLTAAQITRAIAYNGFRFKDPYSIAVVRDLVGVPRFPAVSDEELALGVARYQAQFGLTPDGQAGPATTQRLTAELRAEALPEDAAQLRRDNFVTWAPATGTHNGCAAGADAGGLATFFQWDVNFSTSLRNGWLIQEIVNARARSTCGGAAIPETLTPHYWEAWWVDATGNVLVPTAINATRTQATGTAVPAPAHDLWRRASAAPSRGNWSMTARLFTTIRLPAGFANGAVADALALPATAAAPNSDALGLVEARRGATGQWNCCGAPATHFHRP